MYAILVCGTPRVSVSWANTIGLHCLHGHISAEQIKFHPTCKCDQVDDDECIHFGSSKCVPLKSALQATVQNIDRWSLSSIHWREPVRWASEAAR